MDLTCVDHLLGTQMGRDDGLLFGVSLDRLRHHEFFDEEFKEPSVLQLVPLVPEIDEHLVEDGHLAALIVGRALSRDELVLATHRIVQGAGFLLIVQDIEKHVAGGGDPGPSIVHLLSQARGRHVGEVLGRIRGRSQKGDKELENLIEMQRNQMGFNGSRLGRGRDEVQGERLEKIVMKIEVGDWEKGRKELGRGRRADGKVNQVKHWYLLAKTSQNAYDFNCA